jgi:GNAT superfamily N-acetyltransferase
VVESGVQHRSHSLPAGLRLAQHNDTQRLFDICKAAYRENGFGGMDDAAVYEVIDRAIRREGFIFALIDGPDRIEAVLGLQPCKMWYGGDNDWYWCELLFYVHPLHRRSRHAFKLFEFARWWERHFRTPVVISVFPTERLEGKEALFERYTTRRVGSFYLVGDGIFHTMPKVA